MERINFIKKHIAIFVISLIAIIVLSVMIKYSVEGETNIPFEISKIIVISTAGGIEKEEPEAKWDLNLLQSNVIYIEIKKNKNYNEEEIIDKIIIDNFTIDKSPAKGQIEIYRLSNKNGIFNNTEEYKIENKVTYLGDQSSDLENFKIANQGGRILMQFVNTNIGTYSSNEDKEIRHDGTLLGKAGITNEDIKFNISFDVSIELKSEKKYKTTITLEMPKGNLIEEGTTYYQVNKEDIIFKRY